MSFDDLYDNFKIVKQEVKGTTSSSSSSSSQNMAFMSSPSSTNKVNTAYEVSTANTQVSPTSTQVSIASTQVSTTNLSDNTVYAFLASQPNGSQLVYEDLEQIHEDDIEEIDLKWQLALLSMRIRRFFQETGRKIIINGSDTAGYDKSKVECFNCQEMGHFVWECRGPRNQDSRNRKQDSSRRTINVEETSSKAMVAIDGAGFDWSYMADDEVPTNMALMAFSDSEVHNDKTCSKTYLKSFETLKTQLDDLRIEFNKSEFNLATYKIGLASVEDQLVFYKKNKVIFCEQLAVLKRDISYKDSEISMLKRLFSSPKFDLSNSGLEEFQQPEFEGYGPKTSKSVSKDISNEVRESPAAPLVKELMLDVKLEKKAAFPTVAKIEFVKAKQQEKPVRKPVKYAEMYSFDHVQADCNYHQRERVVSGNNYTRVNYNYSAKKTHPSAYRNMVPRAVLMKTGLRSLNTARPVNTAHPKTTVYSARPMSHFSKSAQSTVKRPYQIRTTLTNKNFSQKVNTAKGKFYTARPKAVNTARPNSAVVNAVRVNQVNVVKALACWVWRPTKLNSASITLKRHNYVDARGRSKSGTCPISQTSRNLMKDMLPLGEEPNEGKLLVKELLKLMCDKKYSVLFIDTGCFVLSPDFKLADESQVLLKVPRKNSVDIKNIVPKESLTCLVAKATLDESMLWHRRLGHVNFKTINKLVKENLVRGLPTKHFENDQTCVVCLKGKQHKASYKSKILNSITQLLFMLHMDLFGPTFVSSLMNKKYCLVVTDDYSRFSWVFFLATKDETSGILKSFITKVENLVDKKAEAINIACYVQNRVLVVKPHNKTPYELFRGRTLALSFMRPFGCHVTIINILDYLGKFDGKSDEGFFVRYSMNSTNSNDFVDGSLFDSSLKNASNDEPQPPSDAGKKDDEGVCKESGIADQERPENSTQGVNTVRPSINTEPDMFSLEDNATLEATHVDFFSDETEVEISNITTTYPVPSTLNTRIYKDHSLDHVIGDV
ncbi:putative ribonuclease H-like domain-containing protein [Tanacetum coccineum]